MMREEEQDCKHRLVGDGHGFWVGGHEVVPTANAAWGTGIMCLR
jgi:hypothetical protein